MLLCRERGGGGGEVKLYNSQARFFKPLKDPAPVTISTRCHTCREAGDVRRFVRFPACRRFMHKHGDSLGNDEPLFLLKLTSTRCFLEIPSPRFLQFSALRDSLMEPTQTSFSALTGSRPPSSTIPPCPQITCARWRLVDCTAFIFPER